MGYPVARVGNMVRVGKDVGKIITGAAHHTVDGAAGGGVATVENGLVSIYGDEDVKAMTGENADDHPAASEPGSSPPDGTDVVEEGQNDTVAENVTCNGLSGNASSSTVLTSGTDKNGRAFSYTLGQFTTGALFPHSLRPQHGFNKAQLICNLKALAENCVKRIATEYGAGSFRINSGFRQGNGSSQHQRGMAVDLQFPGKNPTQMLAIATWIRDNVPYDQLIQEKGSGIWIHVSFDRTKNTQRKDVRTCPNATSSSPSYNRGLYRL